MQSLLKRCVAPDIEVSSQIIQFSPPLKTVCNSPVSVAVHLIQDASHPGKDAMKMIDIALQII